MRLEGTPTSGLVAQVCARGVETFLPEGWKMRLGRLWGRCAAFLCDAPESERLRGGSDGVEMGRCW